MIVFLYFKIKRVFVLAIFFAFLSGSMFGQINTDSIKLKLQNTKGDSLRIKVLVDLAWFLTREGKLDEGLNYCEVLKNTSERVSNYQGLGNAYIISGYIYEEKENFVTAINHYTKAFDAFSKGKVKAGIRRATEHIARCYENFGKHELAIKFFTKALAGSEEAKDSVMMAAIYNFMGNCYHSMGKYPEGLSAYLKELHITEKLNDKRGQFFCHNNIAVLYRGQNRLPDALKSHLSALKIITETGDKKYIAGSMFNIGALYYDMNDYTKAFDYNNKATEMYEGMGDTASVADCYANRGSMHELNGNLKDALEDYKKAYSIFERTEYDEGIVMGGLSLGNLLTKQKDYSSAKKYLDRSIDLAIKLDEKEQIKSCYSSLSQYYSALGNYKDAFEYYKKFTELKDTLQSQSNSEKIIKQQIGFEFDKKEESLRKENETIIALNAEEKRRQNIITMSISIGFILVLILAVVIYRSLRLNRNKNKIITEQKLLVEEKQKEIVDSIKYARRIQQSLMPTEKYIERNLKK